VSRGRVIRNVRAPCSSASATPPPPRSKAAAGNVESFAGDTLTVAFGVPAAQEDHTPGPCTQRCRCSGGSWRSSAAPCRLRVGIDTGEVLSGGRSGLAGATVVEAARLQHAASAGTILVGARATATGRGLSSSVLPATPLQANGPAGRFCAP
jgi:class 3 adenylate cyclase